LIIPQTTETLAAIAATIANGGVIAFRTDTFYGLGADPLNRHAVQKLKLIKGRDERKPILVIVSDREQIDRFIAKRSAEFDLLAKTFWPGPLTLIGRAAQETPEEITAGTESLGVRLPDDDSVRGLVRACGGALTATSANPSHQEPAKTAPEVFNYFGETIDLIVDGGVAIADRPSTVLDVCGDEPRLVRKGAINWSQIQAALHKAKRV
jgi:L-threonylcarbamoyladenylate synthase